MTSFDQPPGVPGPVVPLPGRTTHVEVGDVTGGPIDPYEWHQASPGLKKLFIAAWINKACVAEGVDPNTWGPAYQTLIEHESGGLTGEPGDPDIVNLYDVNAQAGIPSMGLAQVIQPNAPGENLLDPVVNIRASIRYVKKAYGTDVGKDPNTAIQRVQQADPTKPKLGYQPGGEAGPSLPGPPVDPYTGRPIPPGTIPDWYTPPPSGSRFGPGGEELPTDIPPPLWLQAWIDAHPEAKGWPLGRQLEQASEDLNAGWMPPPRTHHQGGGQALFIDEGPSYYAAAYAHNRPFATAPPYRTPLNRKQEGAFRKWVTDKRINFDPNEDPSDYDMRGFWLSGQAAGTEPGGGAGYPDTFKTPYDTTFSRESKYATANCPFVWQGDQLVDMRDGSLVFSRAATPVLGRARGGPVDMSGYGKRWHLEIQRANGSREQLPLTFKSAGGGVRNWDAGRVGLRPGDEIQLVKHRR